MADQTSTIVNIPGIGEVEFPSTMSDDQINAKAKELYHKNQSTGSRMRELLTSPLVPQIAEGAKMTADMMDQPRLDDSVWEARVRGFLAGIHEGGGQVLSEMTSPINLVLMAAGLSPEGKTAEAFPLLQKVLDLKPVQLLQRTISGAAATSGTVEGGRKLVFGKDAEERILGAAQTAGSLASLGSDPDVRDNVSKVVESLGKGMVSASKRPGFVRGAAIGVMGGGSAAGHPGEAIPAGLAMMALPEVLDKTGRGMIRLSGRDPRAAMNPKALKDLQDTAKAERSAQEMLTKERSAADKAQIAREKALLKEPPPSGTRNIDIQGPIHGIRVQQPTGKSTERVPYGGTPAEASGRVQKVMAGETREAEKAAAAAAKAQANDERLAAIEAAKEGLEPGKPSISESISATTPEGGRTSMSTRFKKPGTDVDPRIAELKKRYPNITDEALRKALGSDPGVLSPLGGPTRPAIRVTEPKPRVQAEQENIGRSGATYGEGGIVPGPMPTELTPEPVTPPSRGTYTEAEGVGAVIPHDLTIEGEEGINPPGPGIRLGRQEPVTSGIVPSRSKAQTGVAGMSVNDQRELAQIMRENPRVTPEEAARLIHQRRAMRNEQYSTGSVDPIARQLMNRPEPE